MTLPDILKLPGYGDEDVPADLQPYVRDYVGWNPYDDYLISREGDTGWNTRMIFDSWSAFYDGKDDNGGFRIADRDFNLVADFYFSKTYDSERCDPCSRTGLNPETYKLDQTFYGGWEKELTDDEVKALIGRGRLNHEFKIKPETMPHKLPTAAEVNERIGNRTLGHDAINRWICVETRANRLGVYGKCEHCDGKGELRKSDDYVILYLWMLHPRKGASRGIVIKNIQQEDLDEVKEYLRSNFEQHRNHWRWALAP